jgi:hypothetical protein
MGHCILHQVGQMMTGNAQFLVFSISELIFYAQFSKTMKIPLCPLFSYKLGGLSCLHYNFVETAII